MILYRGAQFDEASLNCYNPEAAEISTFSWNAVTSTSTNRNIAEFFSESNTDVNKISVVFTIEVSIRTTEHLKNLNVIDIKTLSQIPEEDEIILAPGSILTHKF